MSVASNQPLEAKAARRVKLKLLAVAAVSAWARAVIVIAGAGVTAHLVGLDDASGFALIPGIYLALGPPVGRVAERVAFVLVAAALVMVMVVVGARVSGSTAAITVSLVVVAIVVGLFPRVGPRWAAMQLPVLMAFAYSAAFPVSDVSVASRVGVVVAAIPVYLLGAALLFQTEARRPLLLGAAAALGGVAGGLGQVLAGATGAAREAELGLVKFRVASGRLREAAVPYGDSLDSRAARLLTVSIQQAVTATELLAGDTEPCTGARGARVGALARAATTLARGMAGSTPIPPPVSLDDLAGAARADGDGDVALLADALADTAQASAVLRGESDTLPSGHLADLPTGIARLRGAFTPDDPIFRRAARLAVAAGAAGLVASLLDLTRIYWAVFAAVVVLNAPAAMNRKRALMRIAGTAAGFVIALVLLELVGDNATLAFIVAMIALLPAMFLMPINYGAAVVFITCTVSMMYSSSGDEADFLRYRLVDNLVGVAVVCGVGLTLWRASRADWWRIAGLTAGTLANTFGSPSTAVDRDRLVTRVLQLRTETVEAAALPDTSPAFAASWTYVGAAEDLIRSLVVPTADQAPTDGAGVAIGLRAIEAQCRIGAPPAPADAAPPTPTTRAQLDVARMATAVAVLHRTQAPSP